MAAGGGGRDGLGRSEKVGRRGRFGPRGRKEKKKRLGWAGIKGEKEREKKGFAFFLKLIQTIQFKFKFREFKFKLNNKK